jgi:hypothetical protein
MSFLVHFEHIEDKRTDINKEYDLLDMVFLTMAAVLAGAKGWKAVKIFGDAQLDWLRQYRQFSSGIPTRHSIGRIIRGIKAESRTKKSISPLMAKFSGAQDMALRLTHYN